VQLRGLAAALSVALGAACAAESPLPEPLSTATSPLTIASPWPETQRISAPLPAAGDQFGLTPTICGDLAVVGAWHAEVAGPGGMPLGDAGAAYVYERSRSSRRFELVQRLVAGDAAAGDAFGFAVACSGDTIAVGALFADLPGPAGTTLTDAGAVYLVEKRSDGWQATQKLTAVDAAASDAFGFALSLSRDGLLIGAPYVDQPPPTPLPDVGAAYVYSRSSAGFTVDSKLLARAGAASDFFGRAVALSGETALIGAMHRDVKVGDAVAADAGAAFVFAHRGGRWSQTQELSASDAASRDLFGFAVALADDVAVVSPICPSGSQAAHAAMPAPLMSIAKAVTPSWLARSWSLQTAPAMTTLARRSLSPTVGCWSVRCTPTSSCQMAPAAATPARSTPSARAAIAFVRRASLWPQTQAIAMPLAAASRCPAAQRWSPLPAS
jgi:hypothetical protein